MPDRKVDSQHSDSTSRPASRIIGADEFKQALLKHASRRTRSGSKPFKVIGVHLRNRPTLAAVAGSEAVDKLMRALRTLVLNESAPANLICIVSMERILILDVDAQDAATATLEERLRVALSEVKLSGQHVRPSFEVGHVTIQGPDLVADLAALGCEITDHGELSEINRHPLLCTGSKLSWMSRYTLKDAEELSQKEFRLAKAVDRWSREDCVLTIQQLGSVSPRTAGELIKQARELQWLDHPAVDPLLDFWLGKEELICVEPASRGKPVQQWLRAHKINPAAFVDLSLQLTSVLLYLQSLTPPMVLKDLFPHLHVMPHDTRLALSNFHHLVLAQEPLDGLDFHSDVIKFCRTTAEALNEPIPEPVEVLLKTLEDEKARLKADLGTLHKVRSAFREISDKLGAPHVIPWEQTANA